MRSKTRDMPARSPAPGVIPDPITLPAILGWLLGLVAAAAFHWRTRAERRRGARS